MARTAESLETVRGSSRLAREGASPVTTAMSHARSGGAAKGELRLSRDIEANVPAPCAKPSNSFKPLAAVR